MAAVAGSKGKIDPANTNESSVQLPVVKGLLDGSLNTAAAAEVLVANAKMREIGVDTNMVCNLACSYCYLGDRTEEKGTLDLDALFASLRSAVNHDAKLIAFIGKEPLADTRALDIIKRLSHIRGADKKFRVGMVTNGTLVERRIDEILEADPCYIDISIDGISDLSNSLRGDDVTKAIRRGVDAIVESPLRQRFATASVLSTTNSSEFPEAVNRLFDTGVETCFASPILKFAMSKEVSGLAMSLKDVLILVEKLGSEVKQSADTHQIILDMPYKYTWDLLREGTIPVSEIKEDRFEAIYWRVSGTPIILKLNPFSFSYWRACRITHDGSVLFNMDLAAHKNYAATSVRIDEIADAFEMAGAERGPQFLHSFIDSHVYSDHTNDAHDRELSAQFDDEVRAQKRMTTLLETI